MNDLISRQAAIDAVISLCDDCDSGYCGSCRVNYPGEKDARKALEDLPSAQPEQLTDKEQRIFLAAMGREEKVCKEVDEECSREPYEDSLVRICHEITRKVKVHYGLNQQRRCHSMGKNRMQSIRKTYA